MKPVKKDLVCISCPVGCRLNVEVGEDGSLSVNGNQCPKGEEYAREEISAPKRIVTTTVALDSGSKGQRRVPVRTDKPLPVEKIQSLLDNLHGMRLRGPVGRGSVIIENFDKTGVKVIASLTMEK